MISPIDDSVQLLFKLCPSLNRVMGYFNIVPAEEAEAEAEAAEAAA